MSDCTCGICDGCLAAMDSFLCESLCIAQQVCSDVGATAQFVLRNEDNVDRDRYDSIIEYQQASQVTYNICAMGVMYQPNTQRLEKSGLYEEADVAIKTPTKAWLDLGLSFKDIDIKRTTVRMGDETYKIREKGREQVIVGIVPMFYSFGLVKN